MLILVHSLLSLLLALNFICYAFLLRKYVIKKSFFKFFSAIFDFWVYHFFVKKSRISHFAIRIRIFANSHFAIRTKMRKCENANAKKCDEFASHSHSKFAKPSLSLRIRIRILRSRRIRFAFAFEDKCEFTSLLLTTFFWLRKISSKKIFTKKDL